MTERKLPIGVQSFQSLRESGYLYVDKTQYIEQLLRGKVYFLSRPRRFGKSLFLSTLAAYFRGEKELFGGLYLAQAEEELARKSKREAWQKHPVLYIDLNAEVYSDDRALENILNVHLTQFEKLYGTEPTETTYPSRFAGIMRRACEKTGQRVVVLVDEYDKPLLQTLDAEQQGLHEKNRNILAGFYSAIKSCDQYIQFVFLTGVTKFSKLSVFSGLNNLNDISLDDAYAGICGITDAELRSTFTPELQALGAKLSLSTEATLAQLKKKYDGYRFAIEGENVYNPFNLLKVFQKLSLGYYWFATGTPTFLAKKLQELRYPLPDLDNNVRVKRIELENPHELVDDPIQILYQAGYLTIKTYESDRERFTLGFPNDEVRYCFLELLLKVLYAQSALRALAELDLLEDEIRDGNLDAFMTRMQSFIAGMSYPTIDELNLIEWNYQMVFYLVFRLMGQHVHTEVHNIVGRADCVVELKDTIYLFEFKLWSSGSPEDALAQIEEKGYAVPYQSSGKKLIAVGASFDEAKRNIGAWKAKEL